MMEITPTYLSLIHTYILYMSLINTSLFCTFMVLKKEMYKEMML